MPAEAYTLEVPVAPIGGLKDVVVHVTLIFPDAEVRPYSPSTWKLVL